MSKKKDINSFIALFYSSIEKYLQMEYAPKFAKIYSCQKHIDDMIHLTGQYYMGGNTVPETARIIVDYIRKHNLTS